ncbi:hypothetical protein OGAPHI_002649 [Ogataea philodendri]|uniref:Uncharacterized protein n=1 Tax=Ogataea philodendri TaxID=1378263 RepID=A0A9P8PCT2_9ASCO|nr:uncharacterized protein OGAPHI_002649 [Ogataea philodendri]KAH3668894.1 hypothetical protein OGAPHI_002649 [Ogataea philodendri]
MSALKNASMSPKLSFSGPSPSFFLFLFLSLENSSPVSDGRISSSPWLRFNFLPFVSSTPFMVWSPSVSSPSALFLAFFGRLFFFPSSSLMASSKNLSRRSFMYVAKAVSLSESTSLINPAFSVSSTGRAGGTRDRSFSRTASLPLAISSAMLSDDSKPEPEPDSTLNGLARTFSASKSVSKNR